MNRRDDAGQASSVASPAGSNQRYEKSFVNPRRCLLDVQFQNYRAPDKKLESPLSLDTTPLAAVNFASSLASLQQDLRVKSRSGAVTRWPRAMKQPLAVVTRPPEERSMHRPERTLRQSQQPIRMQSVSSMHGHIYTGTVPETAPAMRRLEQRHCPISQSTSPPLRHRTSASISMGRASRLRRGPR